MDDRAEFLDSLNALMQTAELNGNIITAKDMDDCFGKLKINDGQQSMIYNFLREKHIRVQTDEKSNDDGSDNGTSETFTDEMSDANNDDGQNVNDETVLKMYLDELNSADIPDEEEAALLKLGLRDGREKSTEELSLYYLKNVLEISKKYENKGVPLSELIGEGNMAAVEAINEISKNRDIFFGTDASDKAEKKVDVYVTGKIDDSLGVLMEEYVTDHESIKGLVTKYALLRQAAQTITDNKKLKDNVSPGFNDPECLPDINEISEYTNIPVNEIEDVISLSEKYNTNSEAWYKKN